jgi:flagellar basal-body rod modification protein FlgD
MATIGSAIGASATNASLATTDSASNAASSKTGLEQTANKETFLNLLVAQIRNQDPLNPADGTQFVTQLAQFSELEQLIDIRGGVQTLTDLLSGTAKGNEAQTASAPQKPA